MVSNVPDRSPSPSGSIDRTLQWIVGTGMFAVALVYVVQSIHWPLMLDSPIMHYVVFLMQHGLKPYSQITDMNMPGAYLTEWAAMRIFGASDLAWRIYEFFLLGILAAAMCIVAGRRNWIAGIYAAGVFIAMHAAEGPRQAVERDEVIAVLVMLSYAALFSSIRLGKPRMMFLAGLAGGLAASIKPTFLPFDLFLLLIAYLALKRRRIAALPSLLWGVAGLAVIGTLVLGLLLYWGVLRDLLFVLRTVIPVYRGKGHPLFIAVRAIPKYLLPILPFAVAACIGNYRQGMRWNWERWALAGGVFFGLMSYFIQGNGIVYQRYEYLVCLLLLIGMELLDSIRGNSSWRWAGVAAVTATMIFVVPVYMWNLQGVATNSEFTLALESDLHSLGGAATLQDNVQCLDMTTGCLNALYHLGIAENIGFTGDMLLFTRKKNAATEYYRNLIWQRAEQGPAQVIVLSNQDMIESEGFDRLDNWPQFENYLQQNYTEAVARSFPREGLVTSAVPFAPQDAPAYRIYINNQSPLLKAGQSPFR